MSHPEDLDSFWRLCSRRSLLVTVALGAVCAKAGSGVASAAGGQGATGGPVYRLTDRYVIRGADLPVLARASTDQRFAVRDGEWVGDLDLEAARVDWYRSAGTGGSELRLPPRSALSSSGSVWLGDGWVDFLSPSGARLRLAPRPPVLGVLSVPTLLERLPGYAAATQAYVPDEGWTQRARANAERLPSGTSLRVVFGSWCVACEAYVPRWLAVARSLEVPIDCVGVAPTLGGTKDPVVSELEVTRLPTVVVLRDGEEVARVDRIDALRRPERSLARLFSALVDSP